MEPQCQAFHTLSAAALGNAAERERRDALAAMTPPLRDRAMADLGNYEALRSHLKQLRDHTLDNLDYYLARFELEATNNGNRVHFAATGTELNSIVLDICQEHSARLVAKGKSMVTEESGLNAYLARGGLDVAETDLGEYIIQQAGEAPSHIVAPALHKSREAIRDLFLDKHPLGERDLTEVNELVAEAREVLRDKFLRADIGVVGANALIAENGYTMLVSNEGNADLCANLPSVLVVCTTLERILPRSEDAAALQRLLVRSATGQAQTCYTSFYSGPRREHDSDGPLETHIILLDNRRSDILASDYRDMLHCIRCGACLNHCPIFTAVGGHSYGSVYPGPMGSVLTPLLTSLEQAEALPHACTSCGRCAEVCPADIPLPDLLRDLRHQQSQAQIGPRRWRYGLRLHAALAARPRLYRFVADVVTALLAALGSRRGRFKRLPLAAGWTNTRDFPAPQGKTFMQQYSARGGGDE